MSLGTSITDPSTSVQTLANVGHNAQYLDPIIRHGNLAYQAGNYLELPGTGGNYATFPSTPLVGTDWSVEVVGVFSSSSFYLVSGATASDRLAFDGTIFYCGANLGASSFPITALTTSTEQSVILVEKIGSDMFVYQDGTLLGSTIGDITGSTAYQTLGGQVFGSGIPGLDGRIYSAQVIDDGVTILDIDFATFPRNSITGKAETGQIVIIEQNSDPYAIITAEQLVSDATQDTLNSAPIYLPRETTGSYLHLPGLTNNNAQITTPTGSTPAGDFVVQALFEQKEPAPASAYLMSQYNSNADNRSWGLNITTGNIPRFITSSNGQAAVVAVADASIPVGIKQWLRASYVSSTGVVTFATSTDGQTWAQLGAPKQAVVGPVYPVDTPIAAGSDQSGLGPFLGKIYRTVLIDDGVTTFDVGFTNLAHGTTSFTCSTGQTVTVNRTGADPATIIANSVIRYNGVESLMQCLANPALGTDKMGFLVFSSNAITDTGRLLAFQNSGNPVDGTGVENMVASAFEGTEGKIYSSYTINGRVAISPGTPASVGNRVTHELILQNTAMTARFNGVESTSAIFGMEGLAIDQIYMGGRRNGVSYDKHTAIDIEAVYEFEDPGTPELREELRAGINSIHKTY